MEDFINQIQDPELRNEVLRLWKLYPKMPIPTQEGHLIIWGDLQLDFLSLEWSPPFFYYADDELSEQLFYERLEQFK